MLHLLVMDLHSTFPTMPRKLLIRTTQFPFHVTARANNQEAFPFELDLFWQIIIQEAYAIGLLFHARIHALVLMPNHLHMLITAPEGDLGEIMREFMRSITQITNLKTGRSGRIFGAPYHWSLISSPVYFCHAYKYVYRNPVRARLCKNVEEYPFSTIERLDPREPLTFPLWYPYDSTEFWIIPNEFRARLNWLNTPFLTEHEELIRKSLRKRKFTPQKQSWKRIESELCLPVAR
jgi:putative transposase